MLKQNVATCTIYRLQKRSCREAVAKSHPKAAQIVVHFSLKATLMYHRHRFADLFGGTKMTLCMHLYHHRRSNGCSAATILCFHLFLPPNKGGCLPSTPPRPCGALACATPPKPVVARPVAAPAASHLLSTRAFCSAPAHGGPCLGAGESATRLSARCPAQTANEKACQGRRQPPLG